MMVDDDEPYLLDGLIDDGLGLVGEKYNILIVPLGVVLLIQPMTIIILLQQVLNQQKWYGEMKQLQPE